MPNADCIKNYLDNATARRIFPGCALGWTVDGEEGYAVSGHYTYDAGAPAVTVNSIFDCASITKSIPVGCLAVRLIDRGELELDGKLKDYVPEYRGAYGNGIRVKHLLTHTLDFDFRLSEYKDLPPEKLLDAIISADMKSPPGEKFCYANATSILLGMALESAAGKSLHVQAEETFFKPLGMRDTAFFPSVENIDRCVPTEIDAWRGRTVKGEVHDESAWALREIMTAGSAGLFSTAPDLLKFVRMLINKGRGTGEPESGMPVDRGELFFSEAAVEAMYANQIPGIPNTQTGLGWELNQEYMGTNRTPTTFGKTGFTGCAVIVDIMRNAGLVLLSNYTYPSRKPSRDMINQVRSDIADLVLPVQKG